MVEIEAVCTLQHPQHSSYRDDRNKNLNGMAKNDNKGTRPAVLFNYLYCNAIPQNRIETCATKCNTCIVIISTANDFNLFKIFSD